MTTFTVRASIDHEPDLPCGSGVIHGGFIVHSTVTLPVDRPTLHGISAGQNRKLADRLARAIDAGAVWTFDRIATDVNGKTFVVADCAVMGRRLHADLKRLGF